MKTVQAQALTTSGFDDVIPRRHAVFQACVVAVKSRPVSHCLAARIGHAYSWRRATEDAASVPTGGSALFVERWTISGNDAKSNVRNL